MLFRCLASVLIFLSPLFAQRQAQQYYYTYLGRNGQMVINNLPPDHMRGKGFVLMDVKAGPIKLAITKSQMSQVLRSPEMISLIDQIAVEHGVDTWLVRAVIQVESAFYENAHSRKGAMGLMQLIPATAKRFNVVDPFDPVQNITGGVKYLRWLIDFFDRDYTKAIAAYNAGENAVKKHNGIPPFAETIAYVPKVMRLWESKSVVADPDAKGAIDYLKKGRGGFLINANANLQNTDNKMASNESAKTSEQTTAPHKPVYYWEDVNGRATISDRLPPKDAKNVKVY
ncbi:MAG: lytic transglycosylase domain-containing protein [Holophagales bacterium]|nr:lytic transglycosylase domain-containing protein [Holophagales bacterium]